MPLHPCQPSICKAELERPWKQGSGRNHPKWTFADFVSFSFERRTLRSGNTYDMKTHPEISPQEKQSTAASEPNAAERISNACTELPPDWIEQRIKANLEAFHALISALKEKMDKLMPDNSARAYQQQIPANVDSCQSLRSQTNPRFPETCR